MTVRVAGAEEGTQIAAEASALANKVRAPSITCTDEERYEASGNFRLNCTVTDEPDGATMRGRLGAVRRIQVY